MKSTKKLTLSKETLAILTGEQTRLVGGGAGTKAICDSNGPCGSTPCGTDVCGPSWACATAAGCGGGTGPTLSCAGGCVSGGTCGGFTDPCP